MPTRTVLPVVLEELQSAGVRYEDITVVSPWAHRKHTEEEMRYLLGDDIYEKVRCVDSDPDRCRMLGTTSRGTPVEIFEEVADADRIICPAT